MERKCISTKSKENDVASTILSGYERPNMTGFNADNGVLEQYYLSEKEIIDTIKENNSNAKHQQDLLQCDTDICRTIPAGTHGSTPHLLKTVVNYTPFRIRKLTPRECGRLMGVDDEDIDKMLAVNSNSQAYKQYGNSIVKQCLVAIFSQMGIQGIPRWNEGLSEKYK